MESLNSLKCVPCKGDEPPASIKEIQNYRSQIPEWEVKELDGIKRFERSFNFKDFKQALLFTNKIGEIAEEEGHHSVITTQ